MKIVVPFLYLLAIFTLQTTLFSKFSFGGVFPDLILLAVISYSLIAQKEKALGFSFLAGFFQDLLSAPGYLHTLTKTLFCFLIALVKENFLGKEKFLLIGFTFILTPLALFLAAIFFSRGNKSISFNSLSVLTIFLTLYHLILMPFFFSTTKKLLFTENHH